MNHVADWVAKTTEEVLEDPPTVPQSVIDFIYDAPDFITLDTHHITRVGDFGYMATLEFTHDNRSEGFAYGYVSH